jgi:hypothetical protein
VTEERELLSIWAVTAEGLGRLGYGTQSCCLETLEASSCYHCQPELSAADAVMMPPYLVLLLLQTVLLLRLRLELW